MGDRIVLNIYAPNDHQDREIFFAKLQQWQRSGLDTILAGDFNCVMSPALDRLGGNRTGRPESAALQHLLLQEQLEDASILAEYTEEDGDTFEPTEFYTYWGPEAASRIDRFYVPQTWTAQVQWVVAEEPEVPSDHQRVRLYLGNSQQEEAKPKRSRSIGYPIKATRSEQIQEELLADLTAAGVGQATAQTWDQTAHKCVDCIRSLSKREKRRRQEYKHRLNKQNRAHLLTRNDLFKVTHEEVRVEHLVRQGQRLERTTEQLCWKFKRASNWERDQTIADIQHLHGAGFARGMTLATKFGTEWKPVLGEIHNTVHDGELQRKFDEFVTVPESRKLKQPDNAMLMAEITEEDVIRAIAALNRHKAAGSDELNNDFFKDAQAVLVPAMTAISNELLKGGDPPASFLEAIVIPLKKKGDSVDAMDFRPISLLKPATKSS